MEILNIISNSDFTNKNSLKEVFEYTSISKEKYPVDCNFEVIRFNDDSHNLVKVKGNISINSESSNLISKAVIFFPEKKYGMEFINEKSNYGLEFIYEILVGKEYFNLVIFDKTNKVISSSTYVFNKSKIIPYPIIPKNISPSKGRTSLEKINDEISFNVSLSREKGCNGISHIWQNLGQHEIKVPKIEVGEKEVISTSTKNIKEMCSGVWMIISVDEKQRLISQTVIYI